jgi:hypothetical protein
MRNADAVEESVKEDQGRADLSLREAEKELGDAKAALEAHTHPQPAEGQQAAAPEAVAAAAAEKTALEQAVEAATTKKTAAEKKVKDLQSEADKHTANTITKSGELLARVNRLSKNLDEYKKMQVGDTGGPVKLEEIVYLGAAGEEQAIFLPTLKLLTIFKCLVCVPTPEQIQLIMTIPKQGVQLFALEHVAATEDIQQFGTRVKGYMLASQLVGNPLDGTTLLMLGLKDAEVRRRVSAALDAVSCPVKMDDVIRKALDVQQKQQSTQLLTGMRGIFGGKGALAAGLSGDEERSHGNSGAEELAAALMSAMDKLMGANAAGFKQAGRFSGGSSGNASSSGAGRSTSTAGAGGSSVGKAYNSAGGDTRQDNGTGRRKCGECGRWHAGDCYAKHEACGRRHNPQLECYGPDPGDKLRRRPWGNRDRRQAAAVLSDAELAASALEGVNVWEQGGSCHVAALQFAQEPEPQESCPDDGLATAAVAGGLRQTPPASFHQQSRMMTRGAAKLLQAEQESEAAAGEASVVSVVCGGWGAGVACVRRCINV